MEEASFLSGLAGTLSFVRVQFCPHAVHASMSAHLKKTLMITISDHQWQSLKVSSMLLIVDAKRPAEL